MTEEQIKHMVDRFLCWRLPEGFNPDGGISFKKTFNEHTAHPAKHEPVGTNLFDATQADAMVRHMINGLPRSMLDDEGGDRRCEFCGDQGRFRCLKESAARVCPDAPAYQAAPQGEDAA